MIDTKVDSLWAATAIKMDPCPQLQGDEICDVVVVGAGFTGLRTALELAEKGVKVIVLESGDVGWGASGRNGGQVNPMLPFNTPDDLLKMVGSSYFERLTEASLNSADDLFRFINKHQIACDARQHGWLRVNHSEKVRKVSESNADIWSRYGASIEKVEGAELKNLSGSHLYKSGVVMKKGGAVQPLSLARGTAIAAQALGVKIFGRSSVTSLRQNIKGWAINTPTGKVNADCVVIATNGYTNGLIPGLEKSIIPLVPIQIATERLEPEMIESILPQGHTISDTRRIIMYARREPDGRIVFGGHGKPTIGNKIAGFDWLIKDAERIFPALKGANWRFRWGGQIAVTEDRLPHFHEPKKGLIAGLGYNGRGVAMSHQMGRCLAERVLGAEPAELPFPSTAIKSIPFRGIQMMGKGSVIELMRLLDRLESN